MTDIVQNITTIFNHVRASGSASDMSEVVDRISNGDFMSNYQIAVFVGSLRKDSFNHKFARAIQTLAPRDFTFKHIEIGDLPLYCQDDDNQPADAVKRLKGDILVAQGLLFVTPEYNRSIPGVLKNAIDQASRPYGHSAWVGIPAAVVGVSVGAPGTCMAQQHLRNVLAYLDVPTLGQPEVFMQMTEGLFSADGHFGNEGTKIFMQGWMDHYVSWVKAH